MSTAQPEVEHDPDARCPDCDHFYEYTNFSDSFYPQWKDICNEQDGSGNSYCHCKNTFHVKRDRPTGAQPAADEATPRYVYKENLAAQMSCISDEQRRVLMCAIPNETWDDVSITEQRKNAKTICDALNQSAAVDALVKAASDYLLEAPREGCPRCDSYNHRCTNCATLSRRNLRAALAAVEQLRGEV